MNDCNRLCALSNKRLKMSERLKESLDEEKRGRAQQLRNVRKEWKKSVKEERRSEVFGRGRTNMKILSSVKEGQGPSASPPSSVCSRASRACAMSRTQQAGSRRDLDTVYAIWRRSPARASGVGNIPVAIPGPGQDEALTCS